MGFGSEFGSKCILLDMIMKDIRLINKQVYNVQNMLDFEENISNVNLESMRSSAIKCIDSLETLRKNLDIDTIHRMMAETKSENHIKNELMYMLKNIDEEHDFVYIKTCMVMKRILKMYFKNSLDDLESFILKLDTRTNSECYNYFSITINKMINLCNKIIDRIAEICKIKEDRRYKSM